MKSPDSETGQDESLRKGTSSPALGGQHPDRRLDACDPARPACPACGGILVERRGKLICSRCRTICETCCEGGRG